MHKTYSGGVETSNMPNGYTSIHIQINASEIIMNLSLIWIVEFNHVVSRNKGKSINLVRLSFQICELKYLFHIQRKRMSNIYMSLLKSNIEGNFIIYVFGKCCFGTFAR